MSRTILSLNRGSSSLKFALFIFGQSPAGERRLASGSAEAAGAGESTLRGRGEDGRDLFEARVSLDDPAAVAAGLFDALNTARLPRPEVVGHRLVHGGPEIAEPRRVGPELLRTLRKLVPLSSLHLPPEIALVEAVAELAPETPQVACFDTAFHRAMPAVAQRLPLPRRFWDEGLRRYGFHGLSYEYILEELGSEANGRRLVAAHLGAGASMAAIVDRRPIECTMGLTPLSGLMMATRPGDLDPGAILRLLGDGMTPEEVEGFLNRECGLKGVSGISGDMRTLIKRASEDHAAEEAIEMYCRSARKHIGALAALMGGVDLLIFTGGVGANSAVIRERIVRGLEFLGLDNPGRVRAMATDEELIVARRAAATV